MEVKKYVPLVLHSALEGLLSTGSTPPSFNIIYFCTFPAQCFRILKNPIFWGIFKAKIITRILAVTETDKNFYMGYFGRDNCLANRGWSVGTVTKFHFLGRRGAIFMHLCGLYFCGVYPCCGGFHYFYYCLCLSGKAMVLVPPK